jgi:superfamily I DNA and/or RNA helicase
MLERKAVLKLATHFELQGRKYRIITPYESQRSSIEEDMKEADLQWGDKVFNVDSFQGLISVLLDLSLGRLIDFLLGNEEDYIIISLVRSRELGFLKNLRRTNVMLTRCKRGMFICSSRAFLSGPGSHSLVGKLLKDMGEESWLDLDNLDQLDL